MRHRLAFRTTSLVWLLAMAQQSVSLQQRPIITRGHKAACIVHGSQPESYSSPLSDNNYNEEGVDSTRSSRRQAIGYLLSTSVFFSSAQYSEASEIAPNTIRPYAPLDALVPAARNRLLLTKCLVLSKKLVEKERQGSCNHGSCESLCARLKMTIPPPSPKQKAHTSNQLTGGSMRAAMNIYTANLRFADSYVLTASNEDRRRYIRENNRLPTVKQVVAADLDLRDLYRNLIETKMDDAQAELYSDQFDAEELYTLLNQVDSAYRQWFALISETDVKAAEKEALLVESPALNVSD